MGTDAVAKAKPDGYTLLIVNVGITSINPTLYPKLPYDADKAFAPISLICELPFVLMAGPSFKPSSVEDLVALAKASPGKVTFASSGQGGSPHLTAELFARDGHEHDACALQGRRSRDDHAQRSPALPEVPTLAEAGVATPNPGRGSRFSPRQEPRRRSSTGWRPM